MRSLLVLLLCVAPPVAATSVTVQGEAPLGDNRDASIAAARDEARRRAIEQGVGIVIESSTVVRNYQLVADIVSTRAHGVITDERFTEPTFQGGTVRIGLTASVSSEALSDAACTVLRGLGDPHVAVVDDSRKPGSNVAAQLEVELKGGCATLVTATDVKAHNGDLGADAMARLSAQGVDYAVVISEQTGRVIGLEDATVIVAVMGRPRDVADALFKSFAKMWSENLMEGELIRVEVEGAGFADASAFARALAKKIGADPPADLARRSGGTWFSLRVTGGARALANAADGLPLGAGVANVTDQTRRRVRIGPA